ncbi:MAG TPA: DUF4232 domain-containing protein [Streptosporangiaceae bacterium]|nr:DUF4232 domain-containing protein [Streptosporangiaceae bacterium]
MTLFGSPHPWRRRTATPAGLARPAITAAVTALCAGLLAACSGPASRPQADSHGRASALPSGAPHGAPTVIPPTTPAPASSSPAAAPGGPGPAPAPSGPAAPPTAAPPTAAPPTAAPPTLGLADACSTSGLRVSLGGADGAAGSIYYPLDFRNVSGRACSLFGYPGVSFVAAPGTGQLGGAAVRNDTFGPSLVTLAPGAIAHASVQVVVAQSYPAALCKPVAAHFLRVYPPGQLVPLYARLTATTCTGAIPGRSTLGIYVVRPGANGP